MLNIINNKLNFTSSQCIQCAVCLASCPHDALSSGINEKLGQYDILIDHNKCTLCDICTKVCPPNFMYDDTATKKQIENASGLYLGYAKDETVRYQSSTGGVAKTLTKVLLDQKIVDAVYTLEYNDDETEIYGRWIREFESFEKIPNSIYRPIMWGENLLDIDKEPQKVMIIGLPCQIKGAKKLLEMKRKKLEIFSVALMCRQQKTFKYTDFIKKQVDIKSEKKYLLYRGEGWPGKTGIKSKEATKLQSFKASNGGAFGNKLWTVNGCFYCSDCLGAEHADITLADPWSILDEKSGNSGENLILVWSEKYHNIINNSLQISKHLDRTAVEKSLNFTAIHSKEKEKEIRLNNPQNMKLKAVILNRNFLEYIKLNFKKNSILEKIYNKLPKVKL